MNMPQVLPPSPSTLYPDSDGKPMADNTLQFECISTIKGGLELLFAEVQDVFIAGDLLWYAVQGDPKACTAPDALVAFGRPKGYRGSYKQWEEGHVAPQVTFEVLSQNNTPAELTRWFRFYEQHGVEEYYIYDPYRNDWTGYRRGPNGQFQEIPSMEGWVSPRLGIRFQTAAGDLELYYPDGRRFASYVELGQQREQAGQRAEAEKQRADRLAAQLRALGINPEA